VPLFPPLPTDAIREISPDVWERANTGDAAAQYEVAECFSNSFKKSRCRECGSSEFDPVATAKECCDVCGWSVQYAAAVEWYKKAFFAENFAAAWRLCIAHYYGIGIAKEHAFARKFAHSALKHCANIVEIEKLRFKKLATDLLPPDALRPIAPDVWKMANEGDAAAQYEVAECCSNSYNGFLSPPPGKEPACVAAIVWYGKAYSSGNLAAAWRLCIAFYYGIGIEKNLVLARRYSTVALKECPVIVDTEMADFAKLAVDLLPPPNALKPVAPDVWDKAKAGDADAQYEVAECYSKSFKEFLSPTRGRENSCAVAVKWYKKAHDGGNSAAAWRLCIAFYYGIGIEKNLVLARRYSTVALKKCPAIVDRERADFAKLEADLLPPLDALRSIAADVWDNANSGDAAAQYKVAECCSNSFAKFSCPQCGAPEQNPLKGAGNVCAVCGRDFPYILAVEWYRKADAAGYAAASWRLCIAYYYGIGVSENRKIARQFFKKAKKSCRATIEAERSDFKRLADDFCLKFGILDRVLSVLAILLAMSALALLTYGALLSFRGGV
jgi:TPR repeat protein